jgi:SAM-dependent methyltransferase
VLDLGCAAGTFDVRSCPAYVVRFDLEPTAPPGADFVQGNAAALPFADAAFDLVVSNHSLEHIDHLDAALAEVCRVLKPHASIYAAVPDASTVTDRLYRWLARGGGHVNAFRSLDEFADTVQRGTGRRLQEARLLCTSLSFLNRRNHPSRPPRKLWLLGGGSEAVLRRLTWIFRWSDRLFHSRASVYGWSCVFGVGEPSPSASCAPPWTNVCVRCGAGHPSEDLVSRKLVRRGVTRWFACAFCGARNFYTDDRRYSDLR